MNTPQQLIGTWRRFGVAGPVYEIIGVGRDVPEDHLMRVRVLESGEEINYKLAEILDDPLER